jgi:hypothetical protein
MRSGGLRVLVAVIVLLVLALWLWHPGSSARAVDRKLAVDAAPDPTIDLSTVAPAREVVERTRSAAATPATSIGEEGAREFDFDLTVIPIGESRSPLPSVEVRIGLEMQALALLRRTEWNGHSRVDAGRMDDRDPLGRRGDAETSIRPARHQGRVRTCDHARLRRDELLTLKVLRSAGCAQNGPS